MSLFKQESINTIEILDQSLWLNKKDKYAYLKHWQNKGISHLRQILN